MKYKERDEIVESLEQLLDFMKSDRALALPEFSLNGSRNVAFVTPNLGNKKWLARIVRALPFANKQFSGEYFELHTSFGKRIQLEFWSTRDAVCRRVVTGKKLVPETVRVETGKQVEVEEYEWICDEPLLRV